MSECSSGEQTSHNFRNEHDSKFGTASLDTEVREIYEVDDTKALSLDQMDLVDGEIPDINELEELDIGRFVFKDETEWPDLVTAKLAETTMKKLKYVESIFLDW